MTRARDSVLHGTGQETFEAVKMLKAAIRRSISRRRAWIIRMDAVRQ